MNISAFIKHCRAKNLSPATIAWYRKKLLKLDCDVPTQKQMENFLARLKCTAEGKHGYFRAFRAYCRAMGIPFNVSPPKLNRKEPASLNRDELQKVLSYNGSKRDRALLLLLADTGIRIGEALNLSWADFHDGYITVSGKTGQRCVPISPVTQKALLKLPHRIDKVFVSRTGQPLKYEGARKIIRRAMTGVNGKVKKSPHTLRHTFARQYLLNGGDAFSLQKILGHANVQTTMRYVYFDTNDLQNKHRKFSPIGHLTKV